MSSMSYGRRFLPVYIICLSEQQQPRQSAHNRSVRPPVYTSIIHSRLGGRPLTTVVKKRPADHPRSGARHDWRQRGRSPICLIWKRLGQCRRAPQKTPRDRQSAYFCTRIRCAGVFSAVCLRFSRIIRAPCLPETARYQEQMHLICLYGGVRATTHQCFTIGYLQKIRPNGLAERLITMGLKCKLNWSD